MGCFMSGKLLVCGLKMSNSLQVQQSTSIFPVIKKIATTTPSDDLPDQPVLFKEWKLVPYYIRVFHLGHGGCWSTQPDQQRPNRNWRDLSLISHSQPPSAPSSLPLTLLFIKYGIICCSCSTYRDIHRSHMFWWVHDSRLIIATSLRLPTGAYIVILPRCIKILRRRSLSKGLMIYLFSTVVASFLLIVLVRFARSGL